METPTLTSGINNGEEFISIKIGKYGCDVYRDEQTGRFTDFYEWECGDGLFSNGIASEAQALKWVKSYAQDDE